MVTCAKAFGHLDTFGCWRIKIDPGSDHCSVATDQKATVHGGQFSNGLQKLRGMDGAVSLRVAFQWIENELPRVFFDRLDIAKHEQGPDLLSLAAFGSKPDCDLDEADKLTRGQQVVGLLEIMVVEPWIVSLEVGDQEIVEPL
jgi:hypothetical protein